MEKETRTVDSGYTKSGVHWSIEQYKLRYATLFETRVNGKSTQFRSRQECYDHLATTGVQSFKKVQVEGKEAYEAIMEANDVDSGTSTPSGDSVSGDSGSTG